MLKYFKKIETSEVSSSDKRLQLINIFKKVGTILGHKVNKIVNVTFLCDVSKNLQFHFPDFGAHCSLVRGVLLGSVKK